MCINTSLFFFIVVVAWFQLHKSRAPYKTSNSFFPPSFTWRASSFARGHTKPSLKYQRCAAGLQGANSRLWGIGENFPSYTAPREPTEHQVCAHHGTPGNTDRWSSKHVHKVMFTLVLGTALHRSMSAGSQHSGPICLLPFNLSR